MMALTCLFNPIDRLKGRKDQTEEGTKMKKFGFATVIASGLAAVTLSFAGAAQADSGHHDWVQDIQQKATVGAVSPTFGNGR
jgi:hypothetical protein